MRRFWLLALLLTVVTCDHGVPPPPKALPTTPQVAPTHAAAGDGLRVMLAELASAKACGLIRGVFNGLRAPDHPDVVTGVLWLRECEATNVATNVTFHITGNGWLWVDQTKKKGGGTFVVRQYVRFAIDATIRGVFDVAYARDDHVMAISFAPNRDPEVEFKTIGDVDVDRQDVWSSIVGAVGTVFTDSPEETAQGEATSQGTTQLAAKLADGIVVTVNLCTGLMRTHLGRVPKGEMAAADVGETRRIPVSIQPGGVMIVGPQRAEDGLTLQAAGLEGGARLTLVCAKHADTIATEFLAGRTAPSVPVLGTVDIRTKAKLQIKPTSCPVVVVVTPLDDKPARFAWERPTSEIAHSMGGPLIHCPAKPTAKGKR